MRPIDADALIEKCGGWYVDECTESGFIGTLKDILATEPTIQPEKTQHYQEGTTSDLISRQAVINAIENTNAKMSMPEWDEITNAVMSLPTIQPVATDTNVGDKISRQAAIDALAKIAREKFNMSDEYNHYLAGLMDGELAIKGLPTIQPEVLACGNGELVAKPEPHEGYWIRTDCGLDVECKCSRCGYKDFVEPRDEYWFKRNYCPNCGARMKGEPNERTD